jgi:putative flavoprotein involved in K+ transport
MTAHAAGNGDPSSDQIFDVIVIGAGQAGLAMAWHLARQNLRFLVLDAAAEWGHTWRTRWDSLRLFTPAQYDSLPGMPFPAPADTYPTKNQVADYLHAYAAAFDLPVRLNARVTELRRVGDTFEAHTGDDVVRAGQVVVATGPFQTAFVPAAAQKLDDSVTQLHSATYRNPQDLPEGPVLVVGGGNSGLQIAEELSTSRRVDVSMAEKPPMLPQRPLGRDLFWWLNRSGLLRVNGGTRLGRRIQARGEFVIGTSRRRLERAGVAFHPGVADADSRTVTFTDGRRIDVGIVIWATGYRPDYSWLQIPDAVRDGQVVHRRGVADLPGLYFLGLPWQHTRGSALLGFVGDDAAYLAERLRSHDAAATRSTPMKTGTSA